MRTRQGSAVGGIGVEIGGSCGLMNRGPELLRAPSEAEND